MSLENKLQSEEPQFSGKIKLLLFFGGMLVVMVVAMIGYFFVGNKNNRQLVDKTTQNTSSSFQSEDNVLISSSTKNENVALVIVNFPTTSLSQDIAEKIVWSQPKKIINQRWFKNDLLASEAEQYLLSTYYEVGSFDLAGEKGRLILAQVPLEGPGPAWYFYIVDFKKQLTVLAKYSWFNGYDKKYDTNPGLTLESNLASFVPDIQKLVKVDVNFTISSLDFPLVIRGLKDRQVLVWKATYPIEERVGFHEVMIKSEIPVFTNERFGTVYSSEITGGFYLHGPDGTRAVYAVEPDFFNSNSSQAQIIWNDGSWNGYEYIYGDQGGCGAVNYISVVTSTDITLKNDLEIIGKTSKGDAIYELKNKNHRLLKTLYENAYFPQENGYKVSYEEYVTLKPVIFWVDPFDRLIKMQNKRFIIPAECGKPVIYLYPEQTTDVSVTVEPKGGMTVSDPFYNGGWQVKAEPNGQLTELKSGKQYPYLFWEGTGDLYQAPEKGFMVKRENVSREIPEKLKQLGLNQNEIKDFMEFWHPRMQAKPYYFVTFLGTQQMNQLAPLTVSPKPDTVVRVLMDFTPLDKPQVVEPLYLGATPQRKGFTVIEWGGVIRK